MENSIQLSEKVSEKLSLNPITVDEKYLREWNCGNSQDFVVLAKGDKPINNNLYRIGGFNYPKVEEDDYFMLLKYTESHYSEDILKMSNSKKSKHLKGNWVIIDKNGVEKIEFADYSNPYLVEGSCLYTIGGNYYNIETKECYGYGTAIKSTDFVFLGFHANNRVLQINKKTGETIIHE